MNLYPFFKNKIVLILNESVLMFLKTYSYMLTLRITLFWFPSFNPFIQPFYLLTGLTDPYIRLFKGLGLPGSYLDFSPMLGILWIQCLIIMFEELKKNF